MVKLTALRVATSAVKSVAGEGLASLPKPELVALAKLVDAQASPLPHTVKLASINTQISGKLASVLSDASGQPFFLKFTGPTQISRNNRQLKGQGPEYHKDGYSTPIGRLADGRATADLKESDLAALRRGEPLKFASGVTVQGTLTRVVRAGHAKLLYTFIDCTVLGPDGKKLYSPKWGPFDLVASRGMGLSSVEEGLADPKSFARRS